ncbi:hypothetical protein ABZ215_25235 [Amycolatopsis sp. NPDC006131]|uniref:hypothetical protein n=1 Tax=Amycolatopsis sp. NPDC006131 TaxID=3156731 RepID=UPI0033A24C35
MDRGGFGGGRDRAGGIARLVRILHDNEALGALEYDLRRYLHVDVRGLFTSPRTITRRQVIVWIRHLPADSALGIRGLAGEVKNSFYDQIHVGVLNALWRLNFNYLRAHSAEGSKPEEPDYIVLGDN